MAGVIHRRDTFPYDLLQVKYSQASSCVRGTEQVKYLLAPWGPGPAWWKAGKSGLGVVTELNGVSLLRVVLRTEEFRGFWATCSAKNYM